MYLGNGEMDSPYGLTQLEKNEEELIPLINEAHRRIERDNNLLLLSLGLAAPATLIEGRKLIIQLEKSFLGS
jgi:hypothetical protein